LVTIKTFLGFLEKDLKSGLADKAAKDLEYIHGAADKMDSLLGELLKLARVGHLQNPPESVSLQEIVKEALDLVAGQIAGRKVQVEVTGEPVWIFGDRPRLVEVFQNLLDNSVKFMADQPAPRIEIGAETEDGEIVLFVRDNGKGIDSRHHSKLFGLFEKLDPHTAGSGIGLALVRRIVEAHGGGIRAQSDGLGTGATFRFTLAKTRMRIPGISPDNTRTPER
jgi:signal transduction histidine kinase